MTVRLNINRVCLILSCAVIVLVSLSFNSCSKHNDSSSSDSATHNQDSNPESEKNRRAFDTVSIALFPAEDALPMLYANEWGILDSLGIKANFFVYRSQMDVEQTISQGKVNIGMSDIFRTVWLQGQKKSLSWLFSTKRRLFFVPNKALRLTNVTQFGDHMVASSRFSMDDYFLSKVLAGNVQKKKGDGTLSSAPIHAQINSMPLRLSMLLSHQVDAAVLNTLQTRNAIEKGYKPLNVKTKIADGFGGYACNSLWAANHIKELRRIVRAYDIAAERLAAKDSLSSLNNAPAVLAVVKGKTFDVGRVPHAPIPEVLNWMRSQKAINSAYSPDTLIFNLP